MKSSIIMCLVMMICFGGLVLCQDASSTHDVASGHGGRMITVNEEILGDEVSFVKINGARVDPQFMTAQMQGGYVPRPQPSHHVMYNEHMHQNPFPIDYMGQLQPPPRYPPNVKPVKGAQKVELHHEHRSPTAAVILTPTVQPLTPPSSKKKKKTNSASVKASENERRRLENHRKSSNELKSEGKKRTASASTISKVTLDTNIFPQQTSSDSTPQIKGIDVQCAKKAMQVRVQFDRIFEGIIYSKGHFSDESCRYVAPKSNGRVYEFVVFLDKCGTNFVDAIDHGGQTYLENTLIVQNEPNVQEIWDTARRIRCLWTGQLDKRVSSNMKIDALDIVSVTYSGDTVESYMDIQLGRGPLAPPVTGLVKIGETLTMVITIHGGEEHDVRVKDCLAHDGDIKNSIQLTDPSGCVLKKKLMGPWQKTRTPSGDGKHGGVVAYSYFQAFKFPDKMEVFLECNIEICKNECPVSCEEEQRGNTSPRHRRSNSVLVAARASTTLIEPVEPVRLLRGIRVVSQDDIAVSGRPENGTITLSKYTSRSRADMRKNGLGNVCMSTPSFITALVVVLLILILACLMTAALCLRVRSNHRTMRNKRLHR